MSFIEDVAVAEFMQKLDGFINSSMQEDSIEQTALTVSCIHRDNEGNAPSVLECSLDGEEAIRHETVLTFDQIAELMEYVLMKARENNIVINKFPITIVHGAMLSAFEQEVDNEVLQQELTDTVFERSILQGMASHLTMFLKNSELTIGFNLMAEIYADTSSEEIKMAMEMGIPNHTPSQPNKMVNLIDFEASSFKHIMK